MAQMSLIFVCVFVAVISFSEAAPFGIFPPQMRMPNFPQMSMPNLGMPSHEMMLNQMMFPMLPPKPPKQPKMSMLHDMLLEQMKAQAKHQKFIMEQNRLLHEAFASHMAALAPITAPAAEKLTSKSKSSKSKSAKSSERPKLSTSLSSSASSSKEIKPIPKPLPVLPGQMALNSFPGNQVQSVSYSTSSSSSNINGVPSSMQSGQMTVNDNGKVTTHVF